MTQLFEAPETENTTHTYRLVVSERLAQDVLEGEATYREAFAFNSFTTKHFQCCANNSGDLVVGQAARVTEDRTFLMRRRNDTSCPKGTDFFGFKSSKRTSDPLVDATMEVYSSTNKYLSKQVRSLVVGGYIETDDIYLPSRFAGDDTLYQDGKAKAYSLLEGTELVVMEFAVENTYAAQPAPQVLTLAHTANLKATEDASTKAEVEHNHHPDLEVPEIDGLTATEQFQLLRLYTEPTTKSEDTGRTYGPFVNLPSKLRDKVAAHNGFEVELDLVSSQPTIAAATTKDEQLTEDVTSDVDVYERLAQALSSTRKEAKTAFNTVMNVRKGEKSRNTIHQAINHHTHNPLLAAKANQYIKSRYPDFHSVVERFRDEDGESFGGHLLSRIESEILDLEDVSLLPAHDAVYVAAEDADRAEAQIRDRFQSVTGTDITPQIHHNSKKTNRKMKDFSKPEREKVEAFAECADMMYDTKAEKIAALEEFVEEMRQDLSQMKNQYIHNHR